jgi:glycerophosphoryl diester phosphodiesterase
MKKRIYSSVKISSEYLIKQFYDSKIINLEIPIHKFFYKKQPVSSLIYGKFHTFTKKNMLDIKRTYLTDENRRPIAVQIDIKTFEKIEQLLEDYALGKLIEENNPEENLSLNEAQEYYQQLKKNETGISV